MNIHVLYRGQIKAKTGCNNEILAIEQGETMNTLMRHLRHKYGNTVEKMLYDDSGNFRQMIMVVLNGSQVLGEEDWDNELKEGDEIMLMSPIAGG